MCDNCRLAFFNYLGRGNFHKEINDFCRLICLLVMALWQAPLLRHPHARTDMSTHFKRGSRQSEVCVKIAAQIFEFRRVGQFSHSNFHVAWGAVHESRKTKKNIKNT